MYALALTGRDDAVPGLRLFGFSLALMALWRYARMLRGVLRGSRADRLHRLLPAFRLRLAVDRRRLLALQPAMPLLIDAALHAVFVGFVLAMVFRACADHLPAILRVKLPYHASFHLPAARAAASVPAAAGRR